MALELDLLEPTVADRPATFTGARRLNDVRGKRLGFVDNSKCNADLFIKRLCHQFGDRYAVVPGPIVRKLAPKDRLSEADLSRLAQCDAVVLCFGDCGTSTSINVADAVEIERRGIPTATVFSTAFADAARKQAAGRGLAELPLVKIPHPMHTALQSAVTERADAALEALVERLTRDAKSSAAVKAPDRFDGANDNDDQEMLFARGWTDGLPVVFPTVNKVAAMIEASGRDAKEQIGPIPPCWRNATIEKIAINAVMAGCKPDYFPVVLAAIDALLDNDCQLYGIQTATNTTAPLLIVNGPIVDKLDINARGNVFGQGARANATIGRAVQLVLRNIGGDIAGETDMATHGQAGKFSSCIAEAEADSPWSPLHVDAGFAADDNTVTVIGASATAQYLHLRLQDRPGHSRTFHRRDHSARPQQHHLPDRAAVYRQPGTCRHFGARRHRQEGDSQCRVRARPHPVVALCQAQRRRACATAARAGSPKSAIPIISASPTGPRTSTSSLPAAPAFIHCSCRRRSAIGR